jgi:tRNA pseudouridine13 synthase
VIPLIGFRQLFSEGKQGEIEKAIFEEEKIKPLNFKIKKMPTISAPGTLRTILVPIIGFNYLQKNHKQLGIDKINVEFFFTLHKGSYATTLLREFMKPKDLIKAGF